MLVGVAVNGKSIFARPVHLRVGCGYFSLRNVAGLTQAALIQKLRYDVITADAAKEREGYYPPNNGS